MAARLPGRPRVLARTRQRSSEVLADVGGCEARGGPEARPRSCARARGRIASRRGGGCRGAGAASAGARVARPCPFVGGHWVPEMIERGGRLDVGGRSRREIARGGWEELRGSAPEVAVVMPCGYYVEESGRQRRGDRPLGRGRVARGRAVFAVDAASVLAARPALVDGVELLAHLLHPDRVPARTDVLRRGRHGRLGGRMGVTAPSSRSRSTRRPRPASRRSPTTTRSPSGRRRSSRSRCWTATPRGWARWCGSRSTPRCARSATRCATTTSARRGSGGTSSRATGRRHIEGEFPPFEARGEGTLATYRVGIDPGSRCRLLAGRLNGVMRHSVEELKARSSAASG